MSNPPATSSSRAAQHLHPLPLRIMHWTNAVAIFIMVGSGWKIYDDEVIFGWLHFPDALTIGKWAQHGLQWHFFGMWIFVLNGLAYFTYGIATERFRQKLFPISLRDILATVGDALRFRLAHDDLTHYNAVQARRQVWNPENSLFVGLEGTEHVWGRLEVGTALICSAGLMETIQVSLYVCFSVSFLIEHPATQFADRKVKVGIDASGWR